MPACSHLFMPYIVHTSSMAQASRVIAVMPTGKRTSLHRTVTRRVGRQVGMLVFPTSTM